jgi:aldose 1-epimerase
MADVILRSGPLEARIVPEIGGSIARFDWLEGERREPLLRPAAEPLSEVLNAGCFPLVPFANRIRDGRFVCGGREIRLAPNMAGDASPLHGQGWLASWTVAQADESAVELLFRHHAGEWPWDYAARQRISLTDDALAIRLACRNLSDRPMPCGLGLHPYYPCTPETLLDTRVEAAWTIDQAVLPVERVRATGRYDLRERRICGQDLDNGFDGWGGDALISWPERGLALRLTSPDAGRFQVYSPADGGFFVAEPVQNANAALNRPEADWPKLGLRLLQRGEEAALTAVFRVERRAA